MSCAINLVALGIGYLVFIQSGREAGWVKTLGKVIGIVVMVASIASAVCAAKCKMGAGGMCPFTVKADKTIEAPTQ